jgi:N-sulfoglucosamine sulfohydrolase
MIHRFVSSRQRSSDCGERLPQFGSSASLDSSQKRRLPGALRQTIPTMKFLITCLSLLCGAVVAADRPNILLLFADDLGRYASAYADPANPSPNDVVKTPVFDRVATEGALFRNAFVSVPSCTPSRAALNTGRHFFRNGSHSQLHHPWQKGAPDPFDKVKGMPVTLQEGGYHIGLTYKLHMRDSIIGGKQNLYNKAGGNLNQYSQVLSKADDKAAAREKILGQVRGNFRDFLAKRKEGQPFFYSFNPTNTHRKWIRGSGKDLWGLNPDDLKGKLPPVLPDVPMIREDVADYLGETMAFDAACEVLIKEVEKMGELDNTIVAISGDHGIPGFPRGKCNLHDFGSRVLLAIRWPGKVAAGRDVKVPVSLIDLAPTFLAAAGLESPDDPNGENLLPGLAPGADDSKLARLGADRSRETRRQRAGGPPALSQPRDPHGRLPLHQELQARPLADGRPEEGDRGLAAVLRRTRQQHPPDHRTSMPDRPRRGSSSTVGMRAWSRSSTTPGASGPARNSTT